MIDWTKVTIEDTAKIAEIAQRAIELGVDAKISNIVMDLQACHTHGCPLRLLDLFKADDVDLLHDVCGINQNLDHCTGGLENCFSPRYAA